MLHFGRIGITRPESFPHPFQIYSIGTNISSVGRVRLDQPVYKADMQGILSLASPEEKQRYAQMGVTVTHDILQRGAPAAKENDLLVLMHSGTPFRAFRIQSVHDKGDMHIDTLYICEEREDLTWLSSTSTSSGGSGTS